MAFWCDPQLWVAESIFSEMWWCIGQKGGTLSTPKSKPNRRGARFVRRQWMGADGDSGSKERENLPTQNDPRDGKLTSFDVGIEEAVEGPDFWLKRSHTYLSRKV